MEPAAEALKGTRETMRQRDKAGKLGTVVNPFNPSTWEAAAGKISLVYIVSSRLPRATY